MADADDPAPHTIADAAASFVEEYDDGAATLETVLAVDDDHETWEFAELPLDSGTFGELVSRNIVVKDDGEYRVSSREGVRAGLTGEELADESESTSVSRDLSDVVTVDWRSVGALAGALVFLFVMRLVNYGSVFRDEYVVSPGNDPYYYRYWMDELLAESDGVTDWGVVTSMPDGAAGLRPLTHASNWFVAELLGGDQWAADMVAAWLPVVATLALGVVIYWLAVVVTDDVRVGVASVVLLALMPVHAVYSGVGFLEHRLYQYFWLGVTLLGLAWLAMDLRRRRTVAPTTREAVLGHCRSPWAWLAAVTFGVALALSAHAWGGSILMYIPAAGYVGMKAALDAREDVSPVLANGPLIGGLVVSALLSAFLHLRWGWHESFIAVVPAVVVVGALGVVVIGEGWRRVDHGVPVSVFVGLQVLLTGVALAAFRSNWTEEWGRLRERADDVFFREHHGATETASLFATENSIILEPLAQLGATFYLAIIVLGWAIWVVSRRYEPAWLLLSVYTLFWIALAGFQVRFAAQLAIPMAVLGGLALVYLLAWVDLARLPRPFREGDVDDRGGSPSTRRTAADGGDPEPSIIVSRDWRKLATLAWIALLVCGMSLFFVPSLSAQTAYGDAEVAATVAIEEHALETDREYPDNFVLSPWGDNRMHNFFVNGEASSYSYAANNFDEFRTASDPDDWYDQFEDRVGYVVMPGTSEMPAEMAQTQLHENYGAGGNETDGLAHYQAIYLDEEASAFAVVPGATITGSGEAGEELSLETEVSVSDETFTYERTVTVDEDGSFAVTVPYPGEYIIGDSELEVSMDDVENGEQVVLE
ncbi:homolog to oligosaccharyl transferase [Natrialba magadii ATCC 43099]|uniref:dolichyl-phosphooligosaccharide-protein glycotransferase n=1 Tax=Natrialba magadii (strain ATCC 43099 / DSM 3394 / CCM 3739 / CIP 104546 / IAM 13178 / JCM 8861 / NBRC 102185 / NCIMB 2190 / MS3) TaxID=547559 RepID=D3SVX0_NATMM|nr:hypothetical protein [Natrialba magadii]ADD03689.1 homolog to oligosaccharyl transferase [Natrialba magadii ATCC 43099]ELY34454.1 hypothetical protein C500_00927 [Natrialba magadii ATCC 43099]